jgi:aspartate kinase
MPVVVQKYGGSSVADPGRIKAVADRVRDARDEGLSLVVVVSAMGETTDRLATLAAEVSSDPHPREMDMLLTAGERIAMALLAMALHDRSVPAVSYTGSQAGILTDSSHGEAQITRITGERVQESLAEGKVVIVAGFQGVDPDRREITTLGRGGSDTTAVALAEALAAEACEILTDVAGVFTADPRIVPDARKLDRVSYDDMLILAEAGAGVLHPSSVRYARDHGVRVHVRSSFTDQPGTWLVASVPELPLVGIAHRLDGGRGVCTLVGMGAPQLGVEAVRVLDEAGVAAEITQGGDRWARLEVSAQDLEKSVRKVHGALLEAEVAP